MVDPDGINKKPKLLKNAKKKALYPLQVKDQYSSNYYDQVAGPVLSFPPFPVSVSSSISSSLYFPGVSTPLSK